MVKRAGAGIDIGISTGRQSELRVGYDVGDVRSRLSLGSAVVPEVHGGEQFGSVRFVYDGQDSALVPSRGLLWRSELRRYVRVPQPVSAAAPEGAAATRFWHGETAASVFHAVNGEDRVFGVAAAGTSFGLHPQFEEFSLGGPVRMGAFANDELRGANYLLGVAGYLKQVGHLPDVLGGHAYAGAWLETGSAFDRWRRAEWHGDVSGGMILETLIGPVFAGGSVGFDGHRRFYISIGPFF
jgi:NTE family protein